MKTSLTTNPELERAYQFVQFTNQNIFLTGKAGTGKTTFLHRIKEESLKRTAVVAPTGVAAINARGMTIHSFFQLPFGPYIPDAKPDPSRQRKFAKYKINILRTLDLLIIDEISMVRSDMLDSIDEVLRRYRYKDRDKPFGGVQLLMIGDLHQLPPVVKPDTWNMLREYYTTPYFFGSRALRETGVITIQLKHIYRQSDDIFINLLNKVRDNQMDQDVFDKLNSRYIPDFKPKKEDGYITLSSHNRTATEINEEKLKDLKGTTYSFKAKIDGDFPEKMYPTAETLKFKIGAQVLFIKNDPSGEGLYYNGKIGQITEISEEDIFVQCKGDADPIAVGPVDWENVKYEVNKETNELEENAVGVFSQVPLKLAWAITIHKSQGLTFERAIIDAASAFAHGQVYVALSRCKSFEGIVLRSKIGQTSVRTDSVVKNYSKKAEENAPTEEDLERSKAYFQQKLIIELFDFEAIGKTVWAVNRLFLEHENTLTTKAMMQFKEWNAALEKEVIVFAKKFKPVLQNYFSQTGLPEKNEALQERIKKACGYFLEKIQNQVLPELRKVPVITDNKSVKKLTVEALEDLSLQLFEKQAAFKILQEGFDPVKYLKIKTDAQFDFEKEKKKRAAKQRGNRIPVPKGTQHPSLYRQLIEWRNEKADELDKPVYEVITSTTALAITDALPTDGPNLLKVKGIGKIKVAQFGAEIIKMIDLYCIENNISNLLLNNVVEKRKEVKTPTKKISFELYKSGKTVAEIAEDRGFTKGTITGHLSYFVGTGELDVFQLITKEKLEEINAFFQGNADASRAEAYQHFNGKFGYDELKLVLEWRKKFVDEN